MAEPELERGSLIRDNDPRMPGRVLVIEGFEAGLITTHSRDVFAICRHQSGPLRDRRYRINVRRIHGDGKPRKSGFTFLKGDHQ